MTTTKISGYFSFNWATEYRKFHSNSPKGSSKKIISAQTGYKKFKILVILKGFYKR